MRRDAQATEYGLTTYRSHLEAETAQFFDEAGIAYLYEPVTLRLAIGQGATTLYTPDFILPELGVVLECKGDLSDPSLGKLALLAQSPSVLARLAVQHLRSTRLPVLVALSRTGMVFYRPASPYGTVAVCAACGRLYFAPVTKAPCVFCGGPPGRLMRGAVGDSGLEAVRKFYAASLAKE